MVAVVLVAATAVDGPVLAVTVYPEIGLLPVSVGAVHEIVAPEAMLALAVTAVGALGTAPASCGAASEASVGDSASTSSLASDAS
jgi:hypothetical protein